MVQGVGMSGVQGLKGFGFRVEGLGLVPGGSLAVIAGAMCGGMVLVPRLKTGAPRNFFLHNVSATCTYCLDGYLCFAF